MIEQLYTDQFFDLHEDVSRRSASAVVPLVMGYAQPTSVVDLGCGRGAWLAEFAAAGVNDYLGIDGEFVNCDKLLIPADRFLARNLARPLNVARRFDLAISLEVAEHLPGASAANFVESLTRLSDVVLFSAAIPHQGGTGHINEQWPRYWQQLFSQHGFQVVDPLRRLLWNNDQVAAYYRQNVMFYVRRARLASLPMLAAAANIRDPWPLAVVHPEHYLKVHQALCNQIIDHKCASLRQTLQLREINLLAFPDWTQPQERIESQLRALMAALWTHPQRARIALVVGLPPKREPWAHEFLGHIVRGPGAGGVMPTADGPAIADASTDLGPDFWDFMVHLAQARVELPLDDLGAITRCQLTQLPPVPLAEIQNKQPLAKG